MRSLRARLLAGTTVIVAGAVAVLGVGVSRVVRGTLEANFDRELVEKGRALASMVEQGGDNVHFDYEASAFPEFSDGAKGAYFEIALAGEAQAYQRSASLRSAELEERTGRVTLPDGRAGREVVLPFEAYVDPGRRTRVMASGGVKHGVVRIAQETGALDQTMAEIEWGIVALCCGATVLAGAAMLVLVRWTLRPVANLTQRIAAVEVAQPGAIGVIGGMPMELQPVVERLNELLERLRRAFERERSFTADVAHELRTPVAGLLATLEVCRSRPRDAAGYERAMDRSLVMLRQMKGMVEGLLMLARADSGKVALRVGQVEVSEVVARCWEVVSERAAGRGMTLRVEGEAVVRGDAELVGMMMNIVLENAVCYGREGTEIVVEMTAAGEGVAVEVGNVGHGLEGADVGHVFERFWRKDAARSETGVHAGLGLSLCERLVELHGGRVAARVEAERFVVRVELPGEVRVRAGVGAAA